MRLTGITSGKYDFGQMHSLETPAWRELKSWGMILTVTADKGLRSSWLWSWNTPTSLQTQPGSSVGACGHWLLRACVHACVCLLLAAAARLPHPPGVCVCVWRHVDVMFRHRLQKLVPYFNKHVFLKEKNSKQILHYESTKSISALHSDLI